MKARKLDDVNVDLDARLKPGGPGPRPSAPDSPWRQDLDATDLGLPRRLDADLSVGTDLHCRRRDAALAGPSLLGGRLGHSKMCVGKSVIPVRDTHRKGVGTARRLAEVHDEWMAQPLPGPHSRGV